MLREKLKTSHRIVIKAGTSILTSSEGRISEKNLSRLGLQILSLMKEGKEVVLVSSGAIAYGMQGMNIKKRPKLMASLQACAAIGQGKLMHEYGKFFSKHGVHTAQLLLTRDGLENRTRFLAARNTLMELFRMKALPIVNENDSVATEEIAFGDNDVLSVQISHLIHADLLIILSDVDGFYLKDKSRLRLVPSEEEIDKTLVHHLKDTKKERTVGGMRAKLRAARTAMRLGVPLMIVNGHEESIIQRAIAGEDVGTLFAAEDILKSSKKKWIAFSAPRKGVVVVDKGAYQALSGKNKSLLPSGMIKVRGSFDEGQVVELETFDGKVFGRGVVRYSSKDLTQIAGKKSNEIKNLLGYKNHDEVIHRDDLVTWG